MCRHAAFVGGPLPLSQLLLDHEHSLLQQAQAPKEALLVKTCADGYGMAWYTESPIPERRASPRPLWDEADAVAFTRGVQTHLGMAAVRSATEPGIRVEADCAPFVSASYAFSLNGYLKDFGSWRAGVADRITPARRRAIRGSTDSEHLMQWILTRVERGEGVADAMANVVTEVRQLSQASQRPAQLNLLLATGQQVYATRAGTLGRSNSLYTLEARGTSWIASEPLFRGNWKPVPEDSLVTLDARGVAVRTLTVPAEVA